MWKTSHLIFPALVINNTDLKKKIYMKELRSVMLTLKKTDWLTDWLYEWIDGLTGQNIILTYLIAWSIIYGVNKLPIRTL